jgi:uncharacterized protein YcnI
MTASASPSRPTRRARRVAAIVVGLGCSVLLASPAFAHVDADPLAVQAGTSATVGFTIEHGCDSSPTTGLKMQFPDGYTGLTPVDKAGWTSSVAGNVVTFTGGPLGPTTKDSFSVKLTAPSAAATTYVPIVQTCVKGELDWITIPQDGQPEPDHPAAMIKVTTGAPTAADLAAPADDPATSDAKTSSSSHTGLYVGLGIGVVVVAAGLVVLTRTRKRPVA